MSERDPLGPDDEPPHVEESVTALDVDPPSEEQKEERLTVEPKSVIGFGNNLWLSRETPEDVMARVDEAKDNGERWVKVNLEQPNPEDRNLYRSVNYNIRVDSINVVGEV